MPAGKPALGEPTGPLTLSEAIAVVLLRNPDLAVFAWEVRAAEARLLRAGLLPNPAIELEFEDLGGSGVASGFDSTETTLALSQVIELGGKRMKRRGLAASDRDLRIWDYEAKRVDVLTAVAAAYVEVLADQQRLALARETVALAERVFATVVARVEAGKVSPIEKTRSRVELAKAHLAQAKTERQLVTARHRLAATWASTTPSFEKVMGDLDSVVTPPRLQTLVERLSDNPDLARWAAEMSCRQRAVSVARAAAVPDVTVTAGVRHLAETNDVAAVAALSVPLFIFDNKQTGIQEAEIGVTQGMQLRQAAEVKVRLALVETYQRLQTAYVEIQAFRDAVLPSARIAFDAVSEAYRIGKLGALDLLDSQRTLFEARRQHVEALAAYHQAVAAVERLIGGPFKALAFRSSK
jgi:cobalt-zinc-cadmium efflux system outer membrane protein